MIDHDKMHDTFLRVVDHSETPARCQFGTLFDFEYGYQVTSDYSAGVRWYMRGDIPPRYAMPATIRDSASNLGFRWSNWIDHAPQTQP